MPCTIPATLQAQIDSFSAQRTRMTKRAPQPAPEAQESPKRLNWTIRIGEIPLPWWNWD